MNLFQAMRAPNLASRHVPIGPIATVLCEGRCCRDRTAPVFLAFGVRGALALCAECRAWQNRIVRLALPELRRRRERAA